jgi:hypothetical protein
MEKANKENFENQWKNTFGDAEWQPSENVWTNIELSLHKSATGQMKKRLLFFQLLAAASIAFAMTIGGVGVYNLLNKSNNDSNTEIAITQSNTVDIDMSESVQNTTEKNSIVSVNEMPEENGHSTHKEIIESETATVNQTNQIDIAPAFANDFSNETSRLTSINVNYISTIQQVRLVNTSFSFHFSIPEKIDPVTDYGLLLLADYTPAHLEKNKASNEKIWTGLSMAAGTFGTAMGGGNFDFASSPDASGVQESFTAPANNTGSTFRMGMVVGGKISDKWVVQGGLSYMQQYTNYVSNVIGLNSAVRTNFGSTSNANIVSPYQLNSNQQFISLPLQAGYLLIDKKFGFQLNAGLATDFFLQNTMSDPTGVLNNYSERGDDSAYRNINLSSLAGTELSYRFGDNYRLSLAPGMRYAMHSILKSNTGSSIQPFTFDVGLRFNYLIK